MKKVLRAIKICIITVTLLLPVICTISGCKSKKETPKKESTLDADQEKFRKEVFDKQ
jgi:hypothetical protein